MDPTERIAGTIASTNPRKDVERVLAYLATAHHAVAAAVFLDHRGEVEPFVKHGRFGDNLSPSAAALWRTCRGSLERGQIVTAGGIALAPLRSGGSLLGVVALWGPQPVDTATVRLSEKHLVRALVTWHSVALSYVEVTSTKEFNRQKLVLHLSRTRWNIKRVAEMMGVTRNTVYDWIEKYQIERPEKAPSPENR